MVTVSSKEQKFKVTPWEVQGDVDYDKLVKQFGTELIKPELLKRIEKHTGSLHYFLKRKIFFSHRDMNWILNKYEGGEKFFLYTGRGPSGNTHLGHLLPWLFTKYLQDKFDVDLYFQMTDDEKFLYSEQLSIADTIRFSKDNILDVIACGFDKKKTFIFSDIEYAKTLYRIALEISKHITFSIVKATFGFNNSTNTGLIFFPSVQAVPSFLPSILQKKNIPCLIPASIDQDPYWRGIARYVAPKLGYYKPAQIHCKFVPGLGRGGKMSSSEPETAILTNDPPELAEKKIMNSYTGGRATVKEQREKGGVPEICPVYHYYEYLFAPEDRELNEIYQDCTSGHLMCGDCKGKLGTRVKTFLKDHQKRKESARNTVQDFMLKD